MKAKKVGVETTSTSIREWLVVGGAATALAGLVWVTYEDSRVASIATEQVPLTATSTAPNTAQLVPAHRGTRLAFSATSKTNDESVVSDEAVKPLPLSAVSLPFVDQSPSVPKSPGSGAGADLAAERSSSRPAVFVQTKQLLVENGKTSSRDVVVHLSNDEIALLPTDGDAPLRVLRYRDIAKATYIHARDPRWDASLPAPTVKVNVPGIFGRARHWVVVQTTDDYVILQLEERRSPKFLQTFELRAGMNIDRPTGNVASTTERQVASSKRQSLGGGKK